MTMNFLVAVFHLFSLVALTESTNQSCTLPWHISDPTGQCVCFNSSQTEKIVKCSDESIAVLFGHCLTVDDNNTYLGPCLNTFLSAYYSNIDKRDKRYVTLPASANHTKINELMCSVVNRTGVACSQCMKGYGPTALQAGFVCVKCESYGIPLYLLLEYGPLTLLFLLLLWLPVSITTAPMSIFVVFCQVVSIILTYDSTVANAVTSSGRPQAVLFYILLSLSNIWNLDFTTFAIFVPPICISNSMTNVHVILLHYLSAFYPLLLVLLTYTLVQLHARGNMITSTLWRPLARCCARTRTAWSPKNSLVDVFASFILLSYSKLFLLFFLSIAEAQIVSVPHNGNSSLQDNVMRFDTTLTYFTREHIPTVLFSVTVFVLLTVLPVLLLCCYPLRCFRGALNSCPLTKHQMILTTFVEKFQGDYCDGLNRSRYDLRVFSSLPMIILSGAYIAAFMFDLYVSWIIFTMWLLAMTLMVLIVRPYKKTYKNAVSGLLLSLLIVYAVLYNTFMNNLTDPSASKVTQWTIWTALLILAVPQVVTYASFLCPLVIKCTQRLKRRTRQETVENEDDEPHRLQSPTEYSPLLSHSLSPNRDQP